jgi:hypothetical protein
MEPMLVGILGLTFFFLIFNVFTITDVIERAAVNMKAEHIRQLKKQQVQPAIQVRERRYRNYTPSTLTPKERAKLKKQALESKPVIRQTKVQKKPAVNVKPVTSTKNNAIVKDAIGGLVNLGISRSDAKILVNKVYKPTIKDAGELVSKCFQKLNG